MMNREKLPEGFVYVTQVVPGAREDIRYASCHNFMGRPADGYLAPRAVLTREAAQALARAASAFEAQGLYPLIFDAYRPQRAVDHFARWAEDAQDTLAKAEFYPDVDKRELFKLGYIARRSGHSRGSTVDLTLVRADGAALDMGGAFDQFSKVSAYDCPWLTDEQRANRRLLHAGMLAAGFAPYSEEWWHYRLDPEPYPDTYFDFEIL